MPRRSPPAALSTPDHTGSSPEELSPLVEDGQVLLCLGLRATLYFRDGHDPEVRRRLAKMLERYVKESAGALKWGADPETTRPRKLAGAGASIADPKTWLDLVDLEEWNMVFHGGTKKDDASPWSFKALAEEPYPSAELSFVTFTLPLSWLKGKGPERFVGLVLDACQLLRPVHGYAGLSLIQAVDEAGDGPAMEPMQGLAFRFLGLEVDFPEFHSPYLEQTIKGVNWLTVLADGWFEKLGGRASLAAALGDGFVFHDFPGGAVIQAGPRPVFGDVNRREDLPHYKKLARALKPIRVEYDDALGQEDAFDVDRTREWFDRLDRDPR